MTRALLAATILAAPVLFVSAVLPGSRARAQPVDGLYVGAGGGANFLQDERVRTITRGGVTSSVPKGSKLSLDTGYVGLGSIGYGFGNGVRVEVEGDYRRNTINGGSGGIPGSSQRGHESKYGAMGNVLFDLDIGSPYVWPYLGAGAGWQDVEEKARSVRSAGGVTTTDSVSGTKGAFAYQAMLGVSVPIPFVVGLSATAEYRYLGMTGNRNYIGTETVGTVRTAFARKVTEDNNHSLLLGLRYAFDVAPPAAPAPTPAPAAAAPAAVRSYLVFFDWDRADLTDRARQIVSEAATASTHVQVTRIDVSGHADRSGTAAYNQGLSRRRADTVAAELVRDGVARNVISIQAFGDTKPLVPTAAGVREPQNRRVEIVLH